MQFYPKSVSNLSVQEIENSEEFKAFYNSATLYCYTIEEISNLNEIEYLKAIQVKLLELYRNALNIPKIELLTDYEYDDELDKEEFEKIMTIISNKLGENRYYWMTLNPTEIEKESQTVLGDLLDDLSDIYKDLKYSLMIYNLNKIDCKEIAIFDFKFDFEKHWNNHCVNALYGINYFIKE